MTQISRAADYLLLRKVFDDYDVNKNHHLSEEELRHAFWPKDIKDNDSSNQESRDRILRSLFKFERDVSDKGSPAPPEGRAPRL